MSEHTVVGVYLTMGEAEFAIKALKDGGYPPNQLSILTNRVIDDNRSMVHAAPGDVAKYSAIAGAWLGALVGIEVGAACLWVPGFGLLIVAGSLSAMLLGEAECAIAGAAITGALGWLAALVASKEHLLAYTDDLKAGKYLVIAHGNESSIEKARAILSKTDADHLEVHDPIADDAALTENRSTTVIR